jgi:hypothetical protein
MYNLFVVKSSGYYFSNRRGRQIKKLASAVLLQIFGITGYSDCRIAQQALPRQAAPMLDLQGIVPARK